MKNWLPEKVTSRSISVEDFQTLTTGQQLARYIALIDRKIRFDELPKKPHGELAHFLAMILSRLTKALLEQSSWVALIIV